jgi:peroxiredoxin
MDNVNIIRPGFFAPTFELSDTDGKKVSLAFFSGERAVFLVLFTELKEKEIQDFLKAFQEKLKQIKLKGGVVLGVSAAGRRELRKKKEELKVDFPLLSDENAHVISQYGVRDTSSGKTLCYPALFVVSKGGLIGYRKVWVEKDFLPELKRILLSLDELV